MLLLSDDFKADDCKYEHNCFLICFKIILSLGLHSVDFTLFRSNGVSLDKSENTRYETVPHIYTCIRIPAFLHVKNIKRAYLFDSV